MDVDDEVDTIVGAFVVDGVGFGDVYVIEGARDQIVGTSTYFKNCVACRYDGYV